MIPDYETLSALDAGLAGIEKRLDEYRDRRRALARKRVARDVIRDIVDFVFILDLFRERDRDRRTRRLHLDRDETRDLARDLAPDLALVLDLAYVHNFDLDDNFVRDYDRDLDVALALVSNLASDFASDLDCSRARELSRALGASPSRSDDIAAEISGFRRRVQTELVASNPDATAPSSDVAVSPTWSARRVLHSMLQVLPALDRPRYREELEAELADLAAAGKSRRAQLAYALGLAGQAWALRRALRAPAPGRAREWVR